MFSHLLFALRKIADTISDYPIGESRIRMTASMGVAVRPEHGTDAATLLRNADKALYAAKRAGRNRVLAYRGEVAGLERHLQTRLVAGSSGGGGRSRRRAKGGYHA